MPSRNELVIRASAVGLDPTQVPYQQNDSKLEQKILWLEKRATAFTGALATGTLTGTAQSASGDTTVIGGITYTYVTALSETAASSTLTMTGQPSDGDIVSVGGVAYTFRTTLTNSGTAPYEVLIDASEANSIAELKKAINASGTAGTDYGTGTLANPYVTATTATGTTLLVVASAPLTTATTGNQVQTAVPVGTVESWTGTFLAGGVNAVPYQVLLGVALTNQLTNLKAAILATGASVGSLFSTGTVVHPEVVAGTLTGTTLVVTDNDYAVTNGSIATTNPTSTGSVLSWGATTLASGTSKVIAANTTTYSGAAGISGDAEV